MNTVVSISSEIFEEIGEDPNFSIAAISYYLRANIGALNNLINASYVVDPTTLEFSPEIGDNEKILFKKLYLIYYLGTKVNSNLYASGYSSALEVTDAFGTVKRVNKTELAKVYASMKRDEEATLKSMLNYYKHNRFTPLAIYGDDTIRGTLCSINNYFRRGFV